MKERRSGTNLAFIDDHYPVSEQEEEIDLIDVWRVLVRQKKIILKVFIACLILAGAFALMQPEKYTVSTVIQIGTTQKEENGAPILIESSQDLLEKIKSAYIPHVLAEFKQRNGGIGGHFAIEANVTKGSNIISLKSVCGPADEHACKLAINEVVEKIKQDHAVISGLSKKNIEVKLASAENALNASREEVKFIAGKKERVLKTAELLAAQLKEKKALLESALKNRGKIASGNAVGAMLALQIDNEIKRNQELIDNLEQRLTIGINQELDDLDKAEKANARLQNEREHAIGQIKNQLLSVNSTKEVVPVLVSDQPSGPGLSIILTLSALLGLIAGLIAAFISEFLSKAEEKENRKSLSS